MPRAEGVTDFLQTVSFVRHKADHSRERRHIKARSLLGDGATRKAFGRKATKAATSPRLSLAPLPPCLLPSCSCSALCLLPSVHIPRLSPRFRNSKFAIRNSKSSSPLPRYVRATEKLTAKPLRLASAATSCYKPLVSEVPVTCARPPETGIGGRDLPSERLDEPHIPESVTAEEIPD